MFLSNENRQANQWPRSPLSGMFDSQYFEHSDRSRSEQELTYLPDAMQCTIQSLLLLRPPVSVSSLFSPNPLSTPPPAHVSLQWYNGFFRRPIAVHPPTSSTHTSPSTPVCPVNLDCWAVFRIEVRHVYCMHIVCTA